MDCSLSTWPSLTQFDDFSWAGLGDIDPLEILDRSFDKEPGSSLPNSEETKPSMPANTIPCGGTSAHISRTENSQAQSGDLYRLTSSDSLIAARWESINAVDLASVLDSAFPRNDDTSTSSAEDVYDLYSGSLLNAVDTFMADSMSEVAEDNTTFHPLDKTSADATPVTPEVASFPCSVEDVTCEGSAIDGESPRSISVSQVGTSKPVVIRGNCNSSSKDMFENRGGVRVNMVQPFPFNSMTPSPSAGSCTSSLCAMDLKESMFPRRSDCVQTGLMMPWSKAPSTSANQVLDREKVVHPSTLHFTDNYPSILDQQVRMADAASVELKRNRAQASRARRLAANQRRAKKYPLQKLIRMSSSPTSTRDRLEQNVSGSVPILHQPVHIVSPSQYPGGVRSRTLNTQIPCFLPVLQSPHVTASHEVLSQANSVQGGPYYCYQQTSATPTEDNGASSGSGAIQSMCTDQDVHSLSSAPTPAFSQSANSIQSLDAELLEQLQTILDKMNVNVRLCIRDALYRLADSAKHRQSKSDTASDLNSSQSKQPMETNTNSIDRWIVNILFCKQPTSFELDSQSHPSTLTHSPNQFLQNFNIDGSSQQQWNTCGSSVNLQEQPLHVVTGLTGL